MARLWQGIGASMLLHLLVLALALALAGQRQGLRPQVLEVSLLQGARQAPEAATTKAALPARKGGAAPKSPRRPSGEAPQSTKEPPPEGDAQVAKASSPPPSSSSELSAVWTPFQGQEGAVPWHTAPQAPGDGAEEVAAAGDGGNTAALRRLLEALQQAVRYPWAARRRGLEGTVVLSFRVSPEGVPVDVRVLRSSGHKMLDEAALRGLKRATPLPRVSGLLRVPISFRLSD